MKLLSTAPYGTSYCTCRNADAALLNPTAIILIENTVLNALYLTPQQNEAYLDILHEFRNLRNEYQQKVDALMPVLKEEYFKLYDEVAKNKGISPGTQKAAGKVHRQEIELREDYITDLQKLEEKLSEQLTENQLCIIDDFKPCLIPPKDLRDPARVGQAQGDATGAMYMLERLRRVPSGRYGFAKEKLIE